MSKDLKPKPEHYFASDTTLGRVLRFFNLLEPGRMVLSISKLFLWASLAILIYVLVEYPQNVAAVLSAIGVMFGAVGNYAFRRHTQTKADAHITVRPIKGEFSGR